MAARTIKRRPHHGDVDRHKNEDTSISGLDSLSEPLLLKHDYEDGYFEGSDHQDQQDDQDDQRREHLHWTKLFAQLIAQWAQWLASIVIGSGSLLTKLLPRPSTGQSTQGNKNFVVQLSPLQEERLRNLRERLEVQFDSSCVDHQEALKQLWRLSYPNRELPPLKSELWKEMGWQGTDPSTDFRGGGFISLENLIFFAKNYPKSFQRLLHKQDGKRAEWEYPFAVAGINLSFMLIQMLDLQSGKPPSKAGTRFLEMLGVDQTAFDDLYCVAFQMLDAQFLAKGASYMEFNEVLKSTRVQLEQELALEDISSIKDLSAYIMLKR